MKAHHLPESAILLQESYEYELELGEIPELIWQSAKGIIHVQYPYRKIEVPKDLEAPESYKLGHIEIKEPEESRAGAKLEVALEIEEGWETELKSGALAVQQVSYAIPAPDQHLFLAEGSVEEESEKPETQSSMILGDIDAFANPLILRLTFQVPDWEEDREDDDEDRLATLQEKSQGKSLVFMPTPRRGRFISALAKNMNALANTSGGMIVVGFGNQGKLMGVGKALGRQEELEAAILEAAFLNKPPVPLIEIDWLTEKVDDDDTVAKRVAVIELADKHDEDVRYLYEKKAYQRKENHTIEIPLTKEKKEKKKKAKRPNISLEDVIDLNEDDELNLKENDDVIVLDGRSGLDQMQLGAHLSGLINAGQNGYILVTHPNALEQPSLNNLWRSAKHRVEKYLETVCKAMTPKLPLPDISIHVIRDNPLLIICPKPAKIPVALYRHQGYVWEKLALKTKKTEALLKAYTDHFSKQKTRLEQQLVYLHRGRLERPISPPVGVASGSRYWHQKSARYDPQHKAMSWPRTKFGQDANSFKIDLAMRLHHALLRLGENGRLNPDNPIVKGEFIIHVVHALASGYEVDIKDEKGQPKLLTTFPLFKETFICVKLKARLNQLFQLRTKNTMLRFPLSNVQLDNRRLLDIRQACQDSGFSVAIEEPDDYEQKSLHTKATLSGIHQQDFRDIGLKVELECRYDPLTRELQYDGWFDTKETYAATLDVRLFLWGTGAGVEQKMAHLQMILYRTISQRLQHLQSE